MLHSLSNVFIIVTILIYCSESAHAFVTRSRSAVIRYVRQAGYVYDRPKVPFELAPPSTARPGGTQQSGYAYTTGTTPDTVSIGYKGASTGSGAGSFTTQGITGSTSTGYSSMQEIATTAGIVSTGYNYPIQTAVSDIAQASSGGTSTNAPTYLPPSLSPSVSDNGGIGIMESSYSGGATVSTSASASSTSTVAPQTDVYLSPRTVSTTGSPPASSPQTAPPNLPSNEYVPPSTSTSGSPPAVSTPAPTYLPPFLR